MTSASRPGTLQMAFCRMPRCWLRVRESNAVPSPALVATRPKILSAEFTRSPSGKLRTYDWCILKKPLFSWILVLPEDIMGVCTDGLA